MEVWSILGVSSWLNDMISVNHVIDDASGRLYPSLQSMYEFAEFGNTVRRYTIAFSFSQALEIYERPVAEKKDRCRLA